MGGGKDCGCGGKSSTNDSLAPPEAMLSDLAYGNQPDFGDELGLPDPFHGDNLLEAFDSADRSAGDASGCSLGGSLDDLAAIVMAHPGLKITISGAGAESTETASVEEMLAALDRPVRSDGPGRVDELAQALASGFDSSDSGGVDALAAQLASHPELADESHG